MAAWGNDKVEVRESHIEGVGLFATRELRPGDVILVRDESREVTDDNPLREGERWWHCDWLENGRQVYLPSPERHMNHSCDANAWVDFRQGVGRLTALRAIRAGEEITNHYSINLHGGNGWDCSCGSERCLRRLPDSFFELPLERQVEMMGLLAPWFIVEHPAEYERLRQQAPDRSALSLPKAT